MIIGDYVQDKTHYTRMHIHRKIYLAKKNENVLHDANEKTWTKYMSIEIIKIIYGQKTTHIFLMLRLILQYAEIL